MTYEEREKIEQATWKALNRFLEKHGDGLALLWHYGNGEGGSVLAQITEFMRVNHGLEKIVSEKSKKVVISGKLRRQVFERDAYRCKACGSHLDLSVDHIHPESKGGTLDLDNLQTLCRPCNASKGNKVAA